MAKKIIEKQNVEIPAQIDNTKTHNTKNNTFIRNEGTPNTNILPSDSPLGLVPLVGDALQVLDIPFNIANKQYGMAALNAGMLLVPNLIEKPIRWIKSRKLATALNKINLENIKFKENINDKNITTDININKPNNTSTINIDGTDIEIHKLKERFNKWADYYGYDKLPENIKLDEIENFMKSTFNKHNTYYRGLTLPYNSEDIAKIKTVLGENASDEEILDYLAKSGRPGGTFVSPESNAAIYGENKNVAILRRKYNLGENPKTWLDDADFNITDEGIKENIKKGTISYPWASIFDNKTIPNELRINIDDFEHVGWLPRTIEYDDIGKVIDINDFDGSKNVYINQMRGEKPKFKFGGMKQDKIFKLKGGMAIPLDKANKLFYLSGAKHEQGGIDVTPKLEAEGGEVIKVNPKSIKVVTAQKIMGGKSPAELVVNASSTGEQDKVFNKVFKYQEDFKDRHNLNDDGTKKAKWGILKKFKNWLFNIPSGFDRVKENDSPTKEASEFIENDIAKRQKSFYKIAKEKGYNSEPYFIPYIDDKEIKINGAGRASSNMLDSLAVNAKKAKVPFVDALGLAVEETKMGATPNISTDAWIDSFIETTGREPTSEEIKAKEREFLNTSFARNFGGIHPQFLINNHEWFKRGWEDSNKYKDTLKNIKSPLQHGLTLYKLGLYNTGDTNHKTKIKSAGNKAIKSKDVQDWLKTSKYAKQIEKYRLGGQMKKQYRIGGTTNIPSTDRKLKAKLGLNTGDYINLHNTTNIKGRKIAKWGTQYENKSGKTVTVKPAISQLSVPSNMIGSTTIQTPTLFVPKKWEDTNKINLNQTEETDKLLNAGDWINLGLNSAGALTNLITGLATPDVKYARMKDATPIIAPKINANVNINAEESAIDEQYYDELKSIDENTSNSQVALNRKRNAAARRAAAKLKVRAAAENIRRDLINKGSILKGEYDKFNIQRQDQIDAYNAQADAAEFNANRTKVADSITGFVSDLAQGATGITNAVEKRQADRINTVLTYMGNPEINPEKFGEGFDKVYKQLYGTNPPKYISKKYNKKK